MKDAAAAKKRKDAHAAQKQSIAISNMTSTWRRWILLGLCLVVAAGGTWALMELVIWNRLPPELVGKWVVQGGEQDGATFDFHRSGALVGRINVGGKEGIINAQATVEGKELRITTQNPRNGRYETKKQTIKTLNATQLVLQDESMNTFRMERADD